MFTFWYACSLVLADPKPITMETLYPNSKTIGRLTAVGLLLFLASFGLQAQNLIANANFSSGNSGWNYGGMAVETNPETSYGGSNASNKTAEVDGLVGLRQHVSVTTGRVYAFVFKATRRIAASTPVSPGVTIKVTGATTGTVYLNTNRTYSNTTFMFANESFSFTIPVGSTDNAVDIQFSAFNNTMSFGVILDDMDLRVSSTLPVQMVSFAAETQQGKVFLKWVTEKEFNNKQFIIQRSADGKNFDSVGVVNGANNNSRHTYTFEDNQPLAATVYYRLKQVDIDGGFTYSKIVVIKASTSGASLQLFPVPATASINYSLAVASKTNADIVVMDGGGNRVIGLQQVLAPGANQHAIDISSLKKGIYFLKISSGDYGLSVTRQFAKL